jgi:serine protease
VTRPANCAHVLAVTGLNRDGYKAAYANLVESTKDYAVAVATGDGTFIQSSGAFNVTDGGISVMTDTSTTSPSGSYVMTASPNLPEIGTSFGAPQAAGVAAMMLALNPALSVDQLLVGITTAIRPFIQSFASPSLSACSSSNSGNCICLNSAPWRCGSGMLDAGQALTYASTTPGNFNYSPPNAYASYFVPDRLAQSSTAQQSGGGGGSMDDGDLGLLAAAALLSAWAGRRRACML